MRAPLSSAPKEPVVALVAEGRKRGMEVVISALTIIETANHRTNKARLAWVLSGLRIVPVTDDDADVRCGRHGQAL